MQFVVFMDLLGTAILPATLALAIYIIVACSLMDTIQVLPVTVLVATLGLPAVLIVLTTRKASMFGWMLVRSCCYALHDFFKGTQLNSLT